MLIYWMANYSWAAKTLRDEMNKIIPSYFTIIISCILSCPALADTYDATVMTDSGTYSVPVEVDGDEVTQVHWPNGGDMTVSGADISDGEATGTNSNGDMISISIDDYPDKSDENDDAEDDE